MSKILFIYERSMPTVSILKECFQRFPVSATFRRLTEVTAADVNAHDVLYLIRPDNVASHRLAACARRAGNFVVASLDDDLLNLPSSNPSMPWRCAGLRKALCRADALISSSDHILRKYRSMTRQKRGVRIDTVVPKEAFAPIPLHKNASSVVKLVYAANPGHGALFHCYILPVMDRLADRYGKKLQFTFVGVRPELRAYESRLSIHYVSSMPLDRYREFMAREQFDLGLAPLHDSEFAKCKYFNKYLEYTLSGIAGVYSAVEPYTLVVENEANGFLAQNTPEGWLDTLCKAIDDSLMRKQCLHNARIHVEENFNPQAVFSRLTEALPELVKPPSGKGSCPSLWPVQLLYRLWRPLDRIYLVWFYLSRTGMGGLIKKCRTHIRERHSYK